MSRQSARGCSLPCRSTVRRDDASLRTVREVGDALGEPILKGSKGIGGDSHTVGSSTGAGLSSLRPSSSPNREAGHEGGSNKDGHHDRAGAGARRMRSLRLTTMSRKLAAHGVEFDDDWVVARPKHFGAGCATAAVNHTR